MRIPLYSFILALSCSLLAPFPLRAGTLTDKLEGNLVRLEGDKVKKVEKGSLADKKVIAFYYSAHWCPPCRAFTPSLAAEYTALKAKYPQFELIFVSSDRDEKAMEEYMAWGKMNYPALNFKDAKKMDEVNKLGAAGIPYMVVVDADGKELAGKGTEDWVHPSQVLPKLKELLGKS
jgi:nucleoredoxin